KNAAPERRLPAPRLADDAERLPGANREVDAIDGAHAGAGAAQQAAADRVLLAQPAYREERRAAVGIAHTRMHAAVWPGSFSSSAGSTVAQRSIARAQRSTAAR